MAGHNIQDMDRKRTISDVILNVSPSYSAHKIFILDEKSRLDSSF